ncbi:MAG TPA: glycerate kinase [Opitutaceae bacterium]|jgi:glycerate kinase|nr:glycerate kinase [Opitutaceae bacterium]
MRVLIAFDKFKDSMSALMACDIASGAVLSSPGKPEVDACPLADGGEGFSAILTRAALGAEASAETVGPQGGELAAPYGIVDLGRVPDQAKAILGETMSGTGTIAVIEMAAATGLALLPMELRDPMRSSSFGTGLVMRDAAAHGVRTILLGVGGSATHDLGLGALAALGVTFCDSEGFMIDPLVPADWPRVASITGRLPAGFPPVLIACDVDNPLLGPRGALAVYGPQKGLKAKDAPMLEEEGARIAGLLCAAFGRPANLVSVPGAGAAGGIAFGLMAGAGAKLLPGYELVSSWLDIERRLAAADIVVTGEGRFDDSSLQGKGPGALARRALDTGKTVHVFAGQVSLTGKVHGLVTHAISPAGMPLDDALANAPGFLFSSVKRAFAS